MMKIWSDVEYVYRCLADQERTKAFELAISRAVRPGDIVLDAGTGSGIMALFAAMAGASRVYAVEIGGYLSSVSRRAFGRSAFSDRIVSITGDARHIDLKDIEKPDVVICEMITSGMIGEMQGAVINALRTSGVIDERTKVIPHALSTRLALVAMDYDFYGVHLEFPVFVDYFSKALVRTHQVLSEHVNAYDVVFREGVAEQVHAQIKVRVLEDGVVNGLMVSSTTQFGQDRSLGSCVSYCQPVVMPVDPRKVRRGDAVNVKLAYRIGEGFDSLKYEVGSVCEYPTRRS